MVDKVNTNMIDSSNMLSIHSLFRKLARITRVSENQGKLNATPEWLPDQTPHTFEEDGRLKLDEFGKDWAQESMKKRAEFAEKARAEAGESEFEIDESIRCTWYADQESDHSLDSIREKIKESSEQTEFRYNPTDWVLERKGGMPEGAPGAWVPAVPNTTMAGHISWRRWVFLQVHIGVFGGHRLVQSTLKIL